MSHQLIRPLSMDYDYMDSPLYMGFHGLSFVALREKKNVRLYLINKNKPLYMVFYFDYEIK